MLCMHARDKHALRLYARRSGPCQQHDDQRFSAHAQTRAAVHQSQPSVQSCPRSLHLLHKKLPQPPPRMLSGSVRSGFQSKIHVMSICWLIRETSWPHALLAPKCYRFLLRYCAFLYRKLHVIILPNWIGSDQTHVHAYVRAWSYMRCLRL